MVDDLLFAYLEPRFADFDKLWGSVVPDNVPPPYIVFDLVSTTQSHTHDAPVPIIRARVQFIFYAETKQQAKGLSQDVRRLLNGLKNTTVGERSIEYIRWDNQRDIYGPNVKLFQVLDDYIVFCEGSD